MKRYDSQHVWVKAFWEAWDEWTWELQSEDCPDDREAFKKLIWIIDNDHGALERYLARRSAEYDFRHKDPNMAL